MRTHVFTLTAVAMLMCAGYSVAASPTGASEGSFAARFILVEWAKLTSPSTRKPRDQCSNKCTDGGAAVEMGISLLGSGGRSTASDLLRLLSLKLDAGASEELQCQIAKHRSNLALQLRTLDPRAAANWCASNFKEARTRELTGISDVAISRVCKSATEVEKERKQIISQMKSALSPADC